MKAHIARNQNAGVPLILGLEPFPRRPRQAGRHGSCFWHEAAARLPCRCGQDRGPAAGRGGDKAARTLVLEPGAYPPAAVLANFKEKDVDTLLDLMKQAQVTIPLKAVVTPSNRSWVFGDLLAHLQEEHAAFTAAKENHTV